MIGKLKKVSVRERYSQQVVRVAIDFPKQEVDGKEMDGDDLMEWLNNSVSGPVAFRFDTLSSEDQQQIVEGLNKL